MRQQTSLEEGQNEWPPSRPHPLHSPPTTNLGVQSCVHSSVSPGASVDIGTIDTTRIRALREHASALQRHLAATAEREFASESGYSAVAAGASPSGVPLGTLGPSTVGALGTGLENSSLQLHADHDAAWASLYNLSDSDQPPRMPRDPLTPALTASSSPPAAREQWTGYYVG
jgi:hypothetical protein